MCCGRFVTHSASKVPSFTSMAPGSPSSAAWDIKAYLTHGQHCVSSDIDLNGASAEKMQGKGNGTCGRAAA